MADKHPHIPGRASHRPGSAPLPHPDVRGSYTRVSSSYSSRFWQKNLFPDGLCFYCIIETQYVIVFYYDGYDR